MGAAADAYAAMIAAAGEQGERLRPDIPGGDMWAGAMARRFRLDPHRELDPNLAIVASYITPDDTVVDVGGGAGRTALPLALRCREVIVVDPSPGMRSEFEDTAREAGITNARFVLADWLDDHGVTADVALVANVTYFVRDIEPFVRKLHDVARRRVAITVWSIPPAFQEAALFEVAHGEAQLPSPSYRDLLPVLWEMGLLPDVRVLPNSFREGGGLPATREAALDWAGLRLRAQGDDAVRGRIAARFDDLFRETERGFASRWRPDARELLITWETGGTPLTAHA